MSKNCLTCRWRAAPRTPQCNADPQYAATCDYPLPSLGMIAFNVTDVRRHLNLATITEGSPWHHPEHAKLECQTWEQQP